MFGHSKINRAIATRYDMPGMVQIDHRYKILSWLCPCPKASIDGGPSASACFDGMPIFDIRVG